MTDELEALNDEQRQALETLLVSLADDEFVIAERYTEWQVRAPSLESDLALANIAQDELGHARLWYDVLEALGYAERELLFERDPGDFRHAVLCERPFDPGDWADAIVRSYLYDEAEAIRLEALADSSLEIVASRVPKLREEERFHRDHASAWLERLVDDEAGHRRVQSAVDRRYRDALTLFSPTTPPAFGDDRAAVAPGAVEDAIVEAGFRSATLSSMADRWHAAVESTLSSLEVTVPDDVSPPAATGRNGEHTDDWFDLYDDFTHTYRDLGRTDTTRIMSRADHG